ncbi:MAG: hypothetical protein ACRCS9_03575 [Hyphomicrobium sp.]
MFEFPSISTQTVKDVAAIATPVCVIGGALLTYLGFRINVAGNRFSKSVDVMMKCSDRYDQIQEVRAKLANEQNPCRPIDVEMAYKRYWGLQQFQFEMFALGLIEQSVYETWMIHKHRLFKGEKETGGKTFSAGWTQIGSASCKENKAFVDFINEVSCIDADAECTTCKIKKLVAALNIKNQSRRQAWFQEGFSLAKFLPARRAPRRANRS